RPDAVRLAEVERELTRLLRRARVTSGSIAADVHPDLDSSSYAVLVTVDALSGRMPEGVRAADVGETLGLHKSTMSRNITVLEQLGLLERVLSPGDARARHLRLTETGSRQLTAALTARRDRLAETLGRWSQDDISSLARLLGRLNDDLE
ncbi:MAG: MarR family winged helix-turn-helix transcriptional regulator, partial [Lapillicoccus sp.]